MNIGFVVGPDSTRASPPIVVLRGRAGPLFGIGASAGRLGSRDIFDDRQQGYFEARQFVRSPVDAQSED